MTNAEWIAFSEDPRGMLEVLRGKVSDRRLRLFDAAWWACQQVSAALARRAVPASGNRLEAYHAWLEVRGRELRRLYGTLRDIVGPLPFRPVTVHPDVLAWGDRTVPRLAQAIYDERRWGDMPILGDALLDAGCDNDEVVAHCRDGQEHVRGCWVLDLCLGKQ